MFAYVFYALLLLACIAVPYLGREVKGSRSWFRFGDFGVQPAEFMKFATNLALAKFLSNANIEVQESRRNKLSDILKNYQNTIIATIFLGLPLVIIKLLQDETGLAIVFIAFIITLYREGLSVNFLIFGLFSALLFVLSLVMDQNTLMIILAVIAALSILFVKRNRKNLIIISIILTTACGVVFGTNYVYNHLEDHQRVRIDVLLGRGTVNLKKEGYNVNQAKIAIGSGGFFGKGYLQGTQTKYDFVPEQDTDFIFTSLGEAFGFVGTFTFVCLYLFFLFRLIRIAERQRSTFSRVYAYSVVGVFFFHIAVNISMTIGLFPVVGIPLPLISYGGSSLLTFTVLVFILLRLDADRQMVIR